MTHPQFTQTYSQFPEHFYSYVTPEILKDAQLIHVNHHLLKDLNLSLNDDFNEDIIANMTAGIAFPDELRPLAQKYTGHQFGYYNPNLGDGRGVLLGQIQASAEQSWDLHLKGSGLTPYSRSGDGRAVLRSSVREYLIGEALHALKVPTTRCLSLSTGSEQVYREQPEPRASYIRLAKTHIRFGHFEWLAQRGKATDLKNLADYVITTVYPELADIVPLQSRYAALLKTITENTAKMIAAWQTVGFCHGVMNTDNMSVAGETFDFGPYAFLDDCKIHYICNHSDSEGRYAYSQQPNIGLWNCQVLALAFSQLISSEDIDEAINTYVDTFNQTYLNRMADKFGILSPEDDSKEFMAETLLLLDKSNLDFHYFFTQLEHFDSENHSQFEAFIHQAATKHHSAWQTWQEDYRAIISQQSNDERIQKLQSSNPKFVLRNYIAQEVIQATENGNFQPLTQWMNWLQNPFAEASTDTSPEQTYFSPPASEKKSLVLSCSS